MMRRCQDAHGNTGAGATAGAIRQAALEVFSQHGFSGTNMRQIAAVTGVDVALISHHFGSKLTLWKAVVDDLADRYTSALHAEPQGVSPSRKPADPSGEDQ